MTLLKGEQINKNNLKSFKGQKVIYLLERDIDKSGRGYYFPKTGIITHINGKTIDFDDRQEFTSISKLRECIICSDENIKLNFKSKTQ